MPGLPFSFRSNNIYPFKISIPYFLLCSFFVLLSSCQQQQPPIPLQKNGHLIIIGNNTAARMIQDGYFETEMHLRFPEHQLTIRNMGDAGNTAGFRPHSGRNSPWAFPGAEAFHPEFSIHNSSEGHFESPDEWLDRLDADVIVAFFGSPEAYGGKEKVGLFAEEINAFILHSKKQKYNDRAAPELIIVGPAAFDTNNGPLESEEAELLNENLRLYSDSLEAVSSRHGIRYLELFNESRKWYEGETPLTIDGLQFNDYGQQLLGQFLAEVLFGGDIEPTESRSKIRQAVKDKNWYWLNDFKMPNGVHAYGRRYNPFGPDNYPYEIEKIRALTANRDTAIWMAASGKSYDLAEADNRTPLLPAVITNYKADENNGAMSYRYGEEALASLHTPDGYEIALFASEEDFPELANPVQLSFDDSGRLWVAVMPSYPHHRPGDPKPNDKLIILEDTDRDGKADKSTVWADSLHIPVGFELAPEGVYVSQGNHLKLIKDTDGDGTADSEEILMSGFDDHDTHHAISAFTADPAGAIYMAEGIFLHSNVETPYGPVRATNGGFYRYDPGNKKLERTAQIMTPNPWGIAFDDWGQPFFLDTSSPDLRWMTPSTINPVYGKFSPRSVNLIPEDQMVRPTAGLEFVSSRNFPEEVQGDVLLCNNIGFLGIKQHKIVDDGTGYKLEYRQDLLKSDDLNFRPVDLEFAPDGSLYIVDWHNTLVGHMQHNARDPLRDHSHGRIYRLWNKEQPLVKSATIEDSSIGDLLQLLELPEYRTRYRARRALRGKDSGKVMGELDRWVERLDSSADNYERLLLEAYWVSQGMNRPDTALLERLLMAKDFRVRATAVRALRYSLDHVQNYLELLGRAAEDPHGRVRLEAVVAASWLENEERDKIAGLAAQHKLDEWISVPLVAVQYRDVNNADEEGSQLDFPEHLPEKLRNSYGYGKLIYEQEGYCITCHRSDGKGLPASGFPPLSESEWVSGNKERLIKLTLHGLQGPIEVGGKEFPGQVPMTPFGSMLNDDEVAAVLNYVRNSFGNKGDVITADEVRLVREATKGRKEYYRASELAEEK